jgi:hypothetical protein
MSRPQPEGQPADRVAIPLTPEQALRALLAVDPEAPAADDDRGDYGAPAE